MCPEVDENGTSPAACHAYHGASLALRERFNRYIDNKSEKNPQSLSLHQWLSIIQYPYIWIILNRAAGNPTCLLDSLTVVIYISDKQFDETSIAILATGVTFVIPPATLPMEFLICGVNQQSIYNGFS
ncbi:hypothetical protein PR048_029762 [Dryococelus australis]|uniref:Uncharacterized protein n=1 Tax=Dryococelus australis TaxID=614101 RepID=A0ABQ9GB13_9NEOP|nr:hypothetical protein PR048_029762 [Dryococelus australis]